ncbi:hypothetical protein [Rhizobium bangladeshense]|uniref:hypothetical protein n=1 Tax=Rhizobium bangladeshense TaxID=1138189 RepID=UPI001C82D319|nr:hypothetical protein [Rhizobium bangladeshense]MBX4899316.1 hypothetical protein [Rhizobium bangladeshense]MBY3617529.1 hypothetical protein [Rhizobium bangladeshense]
MTTVTVYRVRVYDVQSDNRTFAPRWWRKEGAPTDVEFIEESATKIDDMDLVPGQPYTPEGYIPPGHQ